MWVDIIFFAIIIIFALIGLWKGLFESLISLISTAVCVVISVYLAKPCASFINNTIGLDTPKMFDGLIGKFTKEQQFSLFNMTFKRSEIAGFLSMIFAGIVVFILLKLAIYLLAKIFDSITNGNTVLNGLNRVLGMLFGIIKGGIIVVVTLAICTVFARFTNVETYIKQSTVTNWVYNYVDDFTENQLKDIDIQEIIQDVIKKSDVNKEIPDDTNNTSNTQTKTTTE